jgi:hypothetical protein
MEGEGMTISNNPPAAILELTAGQAEAFDQLLARVQADAEHRFTVAQAQLAIAAGDVELTTQLRMMLRGQPVADRYQFKTNAEKLAALFAQAPAEPPSDENPKSP